MGEINYDSEIEKKVRLISDSEKKIVEYKEKIKVMKNDIKILQQKKYAALGKKFLDMCESGKVDLKDEKFQRLFSDAGLDVPDDAEKSSEKKETDSAAGKGEEEILSEQEVLNFMERNE